MTQPTVRGPATGKPGISDSDTDCATSLRRRSRSPASLYRTAKTRACRCAVRLPERGNLLAPHAVGEQHAIVGQEETALAELHPVEVADGVAHREAARALRGDPN